jgi:death-on-curing protein
MVYLTFDDILRIRDEIATIYGERFEVTSIHGLLSALAAPRRSAFGAEAFPTLAQKAAALLYTLVQHHTFWDGNKRIAAAALRLFLERNGAALAADADALRACTTAIARGELRDDQLAAWVGAHLSKT